MSDIRQLAKALENLPGIRSVVLAEGTVMVFVHDEKVTSVLRNLQERIDTSPVAGRVFLRVIFDENDTIGFAVMASQPRDIDIFTRALTGESKPKIRLSGGCPRCGDKGMQYNRNRREYLCKVCGNTIAEDLVEK